MPNAPAGLLYPGDPGVPAGLIPTFKKGFAPRVGVAWDPTGKRKWLVTPPTESSTSLTTPARAGRCSRRSAPPLICRLSRSVLRQPQLLIFDDPYNGHPPPAGTFATPLTNLTLAPNLPLPYAQDWDLNIQRSLGKIFLLEVGYVGTKGTKLPRFVEGNPDSIRFPASSDSQTTWTSGAFIPDARSVNRKAPAITPRPA